VKGSATGDYKVFCGPWPFAIVCVVALLGLFAATFLTYRHILLIAQTGGVAESALCKSSGKISCDAVMLTEYATLFEYISTATLGLMGVVFAWWIALNGLFNRGLRKFALTVLCLYFFAAIGFSWYFLYLMFFVIPHICPWCLVVHFVNAVCLITVLVTAFKRKDAFIPPESSSNFERAYVLVVGLVMMGAVFLGAALWEKHLLLKDSKRQFEEWSNNPVAVIAVLKATPDYDIPLSDEDPVFGSPSAPNTIIFFTDFQCPGCASRANLLKNLVVLNPERLKIVYKNFPLSTECNPDIMNNLHPMACRAAKAAYSAFLLGGNDAFFAYALMLYEFRPLLDKNPWFTIAQKLKLDEAKFKEMYENDPRPMAKIKADIDLGIKLKLSGTPSIFFKNKKIPAEYKDKMFLNIIEELARGKDGEKLKLPETGHSADEKN
jgi:protein-disulfide isomerase/uncharacterized membrane protein